MHCLVAASTNAIVAMAVAVEKRKELSGVDVRKNCRQPVEKPAKGLNRLMKR